MEVNEKKRSQAEFRDRLVQQIISKYSKPNHQQAIIEQAAAYTTTTTTCTMTNEDPDLCSMAVLAAKISLQKKRYWPLIFPFKN